MARRPHGHSMPDVLIAELVDSQGGTARHRCAICAYGLGMEYAGNPAETEQCRHENIAPVKLLAGLPEYQGGPTRHKCATCAFTEGAAHGTVSAAAEDGELDDQGAVEGAPVLRLHRTYERDPRNRAKAIVYHGNRCLGCGFHFDDTYTPEHANGYIEIHHLQSLAAGPRLVNPYRDLIPLCANCHRMVHRRANDRLDLDQLRGLITEASALN